MSRDDTAEHRRLRESMARRADWKQWGPYVAERAWGTVREDYSAGGDAWNYLPHDHARSRAYRWHEDGLAGFCNRFQNICLAIALWNERDPFLKERLFGLTNEEGNHGEDVKEYYYYLDGLPTHAYMRMLYKYPQVEYPYDRLIEQNRRRGRTLPEYELIDALGEAFAAGRYFDVFIEYAKATEEDILCQATAFNRGPDPAVLHLLPQIWYRNTWSWGFHAERPVLAASAATEVRTNYRHLGERFWYVDSRPHVPKLLFTENETNRLRLFGVPNAGHFVKDAFHDAIVLLARGCGQPSGARLEGRGPLPRNGRTRRIDHGSQPIHRFAAAVSFRRLRRDHRSTPRRDRRVLSGTRAAGIGHRPAAGAASGVCGVALDETVLPLQRGALARRRPGRSRTAAQRAAWPQRRAGSTSYNLDVLSVPDKWEYPWFAAWDTAFHCIVLARLDPEWAKRQVVLLAPRMVHAPQRPAPGL